MSLKKQLSTSQARLTEIIDEIEGVGSAAEADGRELNEADKGIIAQLETEADALEQSIGILKSSVERTDRLKASRLPAVGDTDGDIRALTNSAKLPARVKYTKSKVFASTADAYNCGRFLQATLANHGPSRQYCRDNGLISNAMEGTTDNVGGYAVPDPMAAEMIRLVEEFGVFPRYSRNQPMSSDTLAVPKIAGHTTVYWPDQGAAITATDLTLGQVNLVAKKAASLTVLSSELQEDAVVSMVDQIATDFAWNFAKEIDTVAFLGEVLVAPLISGIQESLQAGSNVDTAGGLTLATLEAMLAKLPQYAGLQPRWYMHSWTYHSIVVPALVSLGGTDIRGAEAGGDLMLYGYPVTFTQCLPGAAQTTDDMPVVIGDLSLGSYYGNRRNFNVRQLNELYAANDQIGVMATHRFDVNIHDVGDADNAGCIVKATITAAP